jgi:hypothetical protein
MPEVLPDRSAPAEPWLSFFRDLDGQLSEEISLHCMGGFAVAAARFNYDIRTLSAHYQERQELSGRSFVTLAPQRVEVPSGLNQLSELSANPKHGKF